VEYRGFELSANVSMLFTEVPYLERFAAAAHAGFTMVESRWPFDSPAPSTAELDGFSSAVLRSGVSLNALNFYLGDLATGDRGVASHPDRADDLAANIDAMVRVAERTGTRQFNLLYGQLDDRWTPVEQATAALTSIRRAAVGVGAFGGCVLLEPLTEGQNGRYPLLTADDVMDLIDGPLDDLDNVSLLFDVFHLGNNGIDLITTASSLVSRIAHVQLADSPGRGEPGSGTLPIDATLDALRAAGYPGVVACEYHPATETTAGLSWIKDQQRSKLS
jgi:hydroxypyruvate isomerase